MSFDHVSDIMKSGNSRQWQQAWLEAKQSGATGTKEFWRQFNRANRQAVVTGVAEVDAALEEFKDSVKKRIIVAASKKILRKIRTDAVSLVPKKTGTLQRAIKITGLRRHRKNRFADKGKPKKIGASLTVSHKHFPEQFYGAFVEKGTKQRITNDGAKRGSIDYPTFSFLRPALLRNTEYVKSSFIQAVRDAIADAAKRAKKRVFGKTIMPNKAVDIFDD